MGDTLELLRRRGAVNAQKQVEVPSSKANAKVSREREKKVKVWIQDHGYSSKRQKVEDPGQKVGISSKKRVENSCSV